MKNKKLLLTAVVSLLVGGWFTIPSVDQNISTAAFAADQSFPTETRIELVANDIRQKNGEVTISKGSKYWIQWEVINALAVSIGVSELAKLNTVTPAGSLPTYNNKLWKETANTDRMVQYEAYGLPGLSAADRVKKYSKADTFRHYVSFDTVGKVFVTLKPRTVHGTEAETKTLIINVIDGPVAAAPITLVERIFEIRNYELQTQNIYGQNFDPECNSGTFFFNKNKILLKLTDPTAVSPGIGVSVEGGGTWSALKDDNILSPSDDLGTGYMGLGAEFDLGFMKFSPFIHLHGVFTKDGITGPVPRVGFQNVVRFPNIFGITSAKLSTIFSSDGTDDPKGTGFLSEAAINIVPWLEHTDINLLIGGMGQGPINNPFGFTGKYYVGAGAAFSLFDGNAELQIGARMPLLDGFTPIFSIDYRMMTGNKLN